jgi:hypothetical protein
VIKIVDNKSFWCDCCDTRDKNDPQSIALAKSDNVNNLIITLCKDCRKQLSNLLKDLEELK